MKKKIRKIVALTLASILSFATVGCSNNGEEVANNGELPTGKTIRIWSKLTNEEVSVLKSDLKEWEEKTGNKVEFSIMNISSGELVKVAKSKDRPDVIWGLSNGHTGVFAQADIVEEMPEELIKRENIISENMIDAVSFKNKVYGYPLFAETFALFVNKDKVEEAPKTWEELVSLGQEHGFQYDLTNFFLSFYPIATSGGYIFGENNGEYNVNDIGLDNQGAVKGFELIKELVDKNLMSSSTVGDIPKTNFLEGKSAFYIGGPWDVQDFEKKNMNFSIEKLPSINGVEGKSFLGMQTGYVIKQSENKELAWDLVKFLGEKDRTENLMNAGNRLPAYKDYEYSNPKVAGFIDQFDNAVVKPIIPEMTVVWDPMKGALESAVSGDKTPEEAAKFGANGIKEKIELTQ